MKVFVIAVEHGWQMRQYRMEIPDLTAERTTYTALLKRVIADRSIDLICEESDPDHESIAQRLASEAGGPFKPAFGLSGVVRLPDTVCPLLAPAFAQSIRIRSERGPNSQWRIA